jgi:hypothetical protein
MVALGIAYVPRNAAPFGSSAIVWFATPVVFGAAFTVCYLVWCAICRLIARVVPSSPGSVRLFANAGFLVIMLAVIFVPFEKTATIRMPAQGQVQTTIDE